MATATQASDQKTKHRTTSLRPSSTGTQLENLPVLIFEDPGMMAHQVARRIANLIEEKRAVGENAVLGLPTGSTPIGVYKELIRMHQDEGLDLSNVVSFNLDEYYPMDPNSIQSYHRFMHENFFDHVNVAKENIHIPDGTLPNDQIETHCLQYEHKIKKAGGLDLVLLGIGRSGHIGFNEPGSSSDTRTRVIVLDEITRKDAASDFFHESNVPREAITMGVGTILDAREVILMATGEHKAGVIKRAVEEEPNREVTASFLQLHPNADIYVDRAAASELTREKTPWLVKDVTWDQELSKRAVIWLAQKLQKAILRLEAADFHRNHLHDLLHTYGNVDDLCRLVFEDLRQRITYPNNLFKKKKVILFSPHPDDDVISMGGMLHKLVENKNEVIVAYMTNGSVAVFDEDVTRHLRFVEMSLDVLGLDEAAQKSFRSQYTDTCKFLEKKAPGEVDTQDIQKLKAYIRYTEAIAGIEVVGMEAKHARFLDMPFYHTGQVRKDPIGEADVKIVFDLLKEMEPDHIFVAGDLSDPHGTHRMCYVAIDRALRRYNEELPGANGSPAKGDGERKKSTAGAQRPMVWLYRGAWQEWEIDKADVFLPMSRADLNTKIDAIYKHESQKDRALFPGAYDEREFWQRARDRNTATAKRLDELGLPEFYAAEAFVTAYEMP